MSWYDLTLAVHAAAGLVALLLFWVQPFSRKGGLNHRRVGSGYVLAMAVVLVTSVPIVTVFIFSPKQALGIFLMYLVFVTGTMLWNGWRAPRAKGTLGAFLTPAHVRVGRLNVLGGVAVLVLGIVKSMPLLLYVSPAGILLGLSMLGLARRPPADPNVLLYQHFGGMIGSAISGHVALLTVGGRKILGLGLGGFGGEWLWTIPIVAGSLTIGYLVRHYGSRQAPAAPVRIET